MLRPLSGLTTRGQSFLAAGTACAISGFVLGERDVIRVGVFLLALPLLSLAAVYRTRYRLACTRRLDPPRVPVGQPATVVVRFENVSRLPTGTLLMEDTLPYQLGGRPRFVLERVEPRGVREMTYRLRSDVRGQFSIGPLTIRLADPFGLAELTRSFATYDTLVVTPEIVPLPRIALGGEWAGGGDSRARSVASAGEEDVAPREYRDGDDLRRVHWRSTARYGELMVRREEQPWQSRAAILLDTRGVAHRGDGPSSSFEWAISAAASILLHLARGGYDVRFVDDTGAEITSDGSPDVTGVLLDTLAVVDRSSHAGLGAGLQLLRRGGGDGLVVAILGALQPGEVEALARLRHGTTASVAVLLDVPTWSATGEHALAFESHVHLLRQAGWRVLPVGNGTPLPAVWPLAASRTLPARVVPSAAGPVRVGRSTQAGTR